MMNPESRKPAPPIRAIEMAAPGGPEVLRSILRPRPLPDAGEVVVQARAIGISSADMLIRKGEYKWMPPLPAVPGNELAGVVSAVGTGVENLFVGQPVLVSARELPMRGGCYAEAVKVPAEAVFALPPSIDFADAVSLPNFQLAGALLFESGVRRPQRIVVYGASGGVGLALAQLAGAHGIRCIGVVSTEDKRAFARAAGVADVVLRDESLFEQVRALTGGEGVDVVFSQAGPDMIRNLDLLAPLGTLLSYSHLGGFMPEADFYGELRKRLGKSLGVRVFSIHTLDAHREVRRRLMEEAIALMAAGRLRPPPGMRWPLTEVGAAHAAMEGRRTLGKVVLVPDESHMLSVAAS